MKGLIERVKTAEDIEFFWNQSLTKEQRQEISEKCTDVVSHLMHQANCETVCTECLCVQETSIRFVSCKECSGNTVSPYYV